jgi:hypothetical protein
MPPLNFNRERDVAQLNRVLTYRAHIGGVTRSISPASRECYFCKVIRGRGGHAGVERYLASAPRL